MTLLIATASASFALSKGLNRHFTKKSTHSLLLPTQLSTHRRSCGISSFASCSSFDSRRGLLQLTRRLECLSISATSFGGGGGGGGSDGGGGGDGGSESGDAKASPFAAATAEDLSVLSSDVIVLNVGGMTCGGCAASVKKILESQPQVSSASVNLTTETAIVWPVSEAKVAANWQKQLGEELAKHLSNCGFESKLRSQETEGDIAT